MEAPLINPEEFLTFTLILVRVSMILFLAPVFGSPIIPAQIKIALALITALLLTPLIKIDLSVYPLEVFSFVPLVFRELMIGAVLALMLRLVLEGVQFAGQFIGFQMGFAIVNVIDPQSGGQSSVIAQMAYMFALLVFLFANGHHIVIKGLIESFTHAPPGLPVLPAPAVREIMAGVAGMFIVAVKIGAPTLAVLFLTKVSMGIIAKTVPQMNVLFVGMPLYIIIGLFIFSLSLGLFVPLLGRFVSRADQSILTLLRLM